MPHNIIRMHKVKKFWKAVDKRYKNPLEIFDATRIEAPNQGGYRNGKIAMSDKLMIKHLHKMGIACREVMYVPAKVFDRVDVMMLAQPILAQNQ